MLDHRDQSILMALPLRPRTVFAAKFWALAKFMAIFAVDVNLGSILLLPPLEMVDKRNSGWIQLMRYAGAHAAGTIGAAAFIFLFIVAVQATLIILFKPRWFRRISTAIQAVSILGLLGALFFFPAVMDQIPGWVSHNSAALRLVPPLWYVGVCELLQGTADAHFQDLARIGIYALAAAGIWALGAYALAYGRYTRASLEIAAKAAGKPVSARAARRSAAGTLVVRLMPNPLEQATFRFTLQTMRRSAKHRLILAAYVGTGLAIVLEEIVTLSFRGGDGWRQARQMALLSLPLVISFFLLSGMRFVFNIPSELPANWVFQITERAERSAYLSGVRKCMSLVVVAPLSIVVLLVYGPLLGAEIAIVHAAYCAILSLIMIEALLWRFEKLPFACSYAPGKFPVVALLCGYWLAFMAYTDFMVLIESYFLRSRVATVIALASLGGALWAFTSYRKRPPADRTALVFHEEPEPVVRTLDLTA
jgi:hypothetical protein